MANMLEGGGRTPLLSPAELEGLGYKIVAYPLSLLGVSIRAMQGALASLKVLSLLISSASNFILPLRYAQPSKDDQAAQHLLAGQVHSCGNLLNCPAPVLLRDAGGILL
jgi:hypothetical protein